MNVPDSQSDPIVAIFYAHISRADVLQAGTLVLQDSPLDQKKLRPTNSEAVRTELDLLNRLIDLVVELDPDILTGWEVQNASWGYVDARGATLGSKMSFLLLHNSDMTFHPRSFYFGIGISRSSEALKRIQRSIRSSPHLPFQGHWQTCLEFVENNALRKDSDHIHLRECCV